MGTALQEYHFAHWIKLVFDHPDDDSEWCFHENWHDPYEDNPAQVVQYLTRLFENSGELLILYSNAQIGHSLWYLASNACSIYMFALINEAVPLVDRVRCVHTIPALYQQIFLKRCAAFLSSPIRDVNDPRINPLNTSCYMWWDLVPIGGNPSNRDQDAIGNAIIDVMEKTLAIPHIACQESSLHGLGHWQHAYPDRVEQIIGNFLKTNSKLDPELLIYAQSAKIGCVL